MTRQIPQGQYAYCKYLEIIRVGVFEREQKQVAAAGGLSKNNNKLINYDKLIQAIFKKKHKI